VPLYEYKCGVCQLTTEHLRALADRDREVNCPICHQPTKRTISRTHFSLKGGGWFADGYQKKQA